MTTFARLTLDGQTIQEICPHPSPNGFYTPEIAAQFVVVPDGTEQGYVLSGGVWMAPPPPPVPTPAPAIPAIVAAGRFYNLFGVRSRIDIKASADPIIAEFLAGVMVEVQSQGQIDLGSSSVQQGLAYLESQTVTGSSPSRTYITSADVTRITANTLP